MRESGRLLSDLSGAPAVILRARGETRRVTKLRFIATRPDQLLSVVVLDDGSVENRFIPFVDSRRGSNSNAVQQPKVIQNGFGGFHFRGYGWTGLKNVQFWK